MSDTFIQVGDYWLDAKAVLAVRDDTLVLAHEKRAGLSPVVVTLAYAPGTLRITLTAEQLDGWTDTPAEWVLARVHEAHKRGKTEPLVRLPRDPELGEPGSRSRRRRRDPWGHDAKNLDEANTRLERQAEVIKDAQDTNDRLRSELSEAKRQRNVATVDAQSLRRSLREVEEQNVVGARELDKLRRTVADLRQDRDLWQSRANDFKIDGLTHQEAVNGRAMWKRMCKEAQQSRDIARSKLVDVQRELEEIKEQKRGETLESVLALNEALQRQLKEAKASLREVRKALEHAYTHDGT